MVFEGSKKTCTYDGGVNDHDQTKFSLGRNVVKLILIRHIQYTNDGKGILKT